MSTSAPKRSAGLEKYKEQRDVQLTKNLHEKLTAELQSLHHSKQLNLFLSKVYFELWNMKSAEDTIKF